MLKRSALSSVTSSVSLAPLFSGATGTTACSVATSASGTHSIRTAEAAAFPTFVFLEAETSARATCEPWKVVFGGGVKIDSAGGVNIDSLGTF